MCQCRHVGAVSSDPTECLSLLGRSMDRGDEHAFREGQRVQVVNLKARSELNGTQGTVVEFDPAEQRWKVAMDDGTGKMLRACHLQPVPAAKSGMADSPKRPSEAQAKKLGPNCLVRIKGLQVHPELNGRQGVIKGWDVLEERWTVRLGSEDSELVKNFQQEHLEVLPDTFSQSSAEPFARGLALGCRVRLEKLERRPELNGSLGTVVGWDSVEERWQVKLSDDRGLLLKAANLEQINFYTGARVRVQNLQARADLNGSCGKLVDWDTKEERWQVLLDDGTGKLLREANMQLLDSGADLPPAHFRAGDRVRAKGLQVSPELNGQTGEILELDANGRWKVRLDDGTGKLLKGENLELLGGPDPRLVVHVGGQVRVKGLQTLPELNGLLGTVVGWDETQERWKVRMEDGTGKMFRPMNLMAEPGTTLAEGAPEAAPAEEGSAIHTDGYPDVTELLRVAAPVVAAPQLYPGQRVQIVDEARGDVNGRLGEILAWNDLDECWKVQVESTVHFLKPCQLLAVESFQAGDRVRIIDLRERQELNGRHGWVVDWDVREGRWKVVTEDGAGKLLKPENLEKLFEKRVEHFEEGMRVRVSGLQKQAELNGLFGMLMGWDSGEERWKVLLDDGSRKLLRPANLHPAPEAPPAPPAPPVASRPSSPAPASPPPVPSFVQSEEPLDEPKEGSRSVFPGARVLLHGLQQQWEINGQKGTVVDWDREEQRWQVRLEAGAGHLLRSQNLEVLECVHVGARVLVGGLRTQPELNGCLGVARRWVVKEERWEVMMDAGTEKLFRSANLELTNAPPQEPARERFAPPARQALRAGCRVEVVDLSQQKELNGSKGNALEWVAQIERWKVVLDDGASLLLRSAHLSALNGGWDSEKARTCD